MLDKVKIPKKGIFSLINASVFNSADLNGFVYRRIKSVFNPKPFFKHSKQGV